MAPPSVVEQLRSILLASTGDRPRYEVLRDAIESTIERGGLVDGNSLPSERTLSDALGLSRDTVRRAFADLASGGVLVRAARSRSRVAPRAQTALDSLASFTEETLARGMTPSTRWLSRRTARAERAERSALDLASGERVLRLERLREADGEPVAIERASVPCAVLASPSLVQASLYQALAAAGASPHRQVQRIRAEAASGRYAELLRCDEGAPLLVIERICHDVDGRAVELAVTRYNAMLHELVLDSAPL